jgi:hypothetical protein
MDRSAAQDTLGEHADYLRAARRIRADGRGDPGKIHRSLRGLIGPVSRQIFKPRPRRTDWSHSAILGHRGPAAREFADLVSGRLVGRLLPWSDRRILLRQAAGLGINRFEANLIIAAVQHAWPGDKPASLEKSPRMNLSALGASIGAFLVVQLVIIAAVWRLLF